MEEPKKISIWKKGAKKKKTVEYKHKQGSNNYIKENGLRPRNNKLGWGRIEGNKKHRISLEATKEVKLHKTAEK